MQTMKTEFIAHQDWTKWLDALSDEAPCGPDLEYDPRFRELEEAVSGRPEAEYGATLVAAVPPDWAAADALSAELMAHTRDLRVVAWLARARLAREGMAGLADGLALAATLLDHNWDHVHPQLDASDCNDPTVRINALAEFVDATGLLAELMDSRLVPHDVPVTLREWLYANGESVAPDGRVVMILSEIEVAAAASLDDAMRTKTSADTALANAEWLESVLTERVGVTQALELDGLKTLLRRAGALLGGCLKKQGVALDIATPTDGRATEARPMAAGDVISSRTDVAATLDRLCAYYARHEPASPVPLLLARARGLIDKSFVDLLKELAPEGLAQLTQVIGPAAADLPAS
ncbi:type VI secretion system protein ImpA [Paraburkholderia sp. BL23I1N1]|uniref:type VI secretion system protein TssA n=1 Tax=Paraburkholderia sp. BL23I1N1 TaxID=1938802 RepID=UPI000FF4D802|nr:type VI secretion system protein TssA [Paraburkholderia sp. BL23I1N1]RKE36316.1 type VI secretion system protein ImpA [Paraburkholderia sp. BL23I1N1]